MATLILNPPNYTFDNEFNYNSIESDNSSSQSSSSTTNSCSPKTTCDELPKISKFFSNSSNYQSKIQQLISFSFTSSNFIFITFILSISKLCTTAATDPSQAGAPQPSTAMPSFLMPNLSGSALLEKLNSFRANTVGGPPPTAVKGKNTPAAANSLTQGSGGGSSAISAASASSISSTTSSPSSSPSSMSSAYLSSNAFSLFGSKSFPNKEIKFLNVSGKIGTPLGIGKC